MSMHFREREFHCDMSFQSLGTIGSALSNERLDSDSLVKILWPREKCRLIKDDVVLVDR